MNVLNKYKFPVLLSTLLFLAGTALAQRQQVAPTQRGYEWYANEFRKKAPDMLGNTVNRNPAAVNRPADFYYQRLQGHFTFLQNMKSANNRNPAVRSYPGQRDLNWYRQYYAERMRLAQTMRQNKQPAN